MKKLAFLAITVLIITGSACVNIGSDEVGVKTTYLTLIGEKGVNKKVYTTGYHVYVPPFNKFTILKKTEHKLEMTRKLGEGSKQGRDDIKLKTNDGNDIWVDATISWEVDEQTAYKAVEQLGDSTKEIEELFVRPVTRAALRFFLGKLSSEEFYMAKKREQAAIEAKKEMNKFFKKAGINITGVLINDYYFSDTYQKAIEERKLFDQKAEEFQSLTKASREDAKRKVFDAKATSNSLIEKAKGELQEAKLKGDAIVFAAKKKAEAILARKTAEAEALKQLNIALSGPGGKNMIARRLAKNLQNKKIVIVPMSDSGNVSIVDVNSFLDNLAAKKVSDKITKKVKTKKEDNSKKNTNSKQTNEKVK